MEHRNHFWNNIILDNSILRDDLHIQNNHELVQSLFSPSSMKIKKRHDVKETIILGQAISSMFHFHDCAKMPWTMFFAVRGTTSIGLFYDFFFHQQNAHNSTFVPLRHPACNGSIWYVYANICTIGVLDCACLHVSLKTCVLRTNQTKCRYWTRNVWDDGNIPQLGGFHTYGGFSSVSGTYKTGKR